MITVPLTPVDLDTLSSGRICACCYTWRRVLSASSRLSVHSVPRSTVAPGAVHADPLGALAIMEGNVNAGTCWLSTLSIEQGSRPHRAEWLVLPTGLRDAARDV